VTATVHDGEHPAVAAARVAHSTMDPDQPVWICLLPPAEVAGWARQADPAGPLAGVAFAVKDNLDLAGSATTAARGSTSLIHKTPSSKSNPAVAGPDTRTSARYPRNGSRSTTSVPRNTASPTTRPL